jgi:hypothetical protein
MKRSLLLAQFALFILFNFFLYLTILELNNSKAFTGLDHGIPLYNGKELFDPTLSRLSSMDRLIEYCDSLYVAKEKETPGLSYEENYPLIVSGAIRHRFFHGYSSYGFNDNYMALMLEPMTGKWMSAIVVPDDIMKYPYAACSQQSIVMMALLQAKGYTTRKVAFVNGAKNGHFSFEAYYKGGWHFFDPNLEPDMDLLASRNIPPIQELAADKQFLLAAYHHMPEEQILTIFKKYAYGKPNTFPAPRAIIYQKFTKFLSYTTWVFFLLAFLLVRRSYLKLSYQTNVRNNRVYFPGFKRKRSSSYYPDATA